MKIVSFAMLTVMLLCCQLAAADITSGDAYVDTDDGVDNLTCGTGPAASACRSLSYIATTRITTLTGAVTVHWDGSAADTTSFTLENHSTNATNTFKITVDQANRHTGKYSSSKPRIEASPSGEAVIKINEGYVILDGLQVYHNGSTPGTSASAVRTTFANASATVIYSNCIFRGGRYTLRTDQAADVSMWNTIIFGGTSAGYVSSTGTPSFSFYSSTIIGGSTAGVTNTSGTMTCRNSYVYSSGTAYSGAITRDYCAASDTTAYPHTLDNKALNTTNFTNITTGSEDFHLPLGSGLRDLGIDTSGYTGISNDIDGETRTGSWDIGADEYVAVSLDIAITSPSSYRMYQRDGSNQATITIAGTYSGSPTAIECSWAGGLYSIIDAAPAAGSYSGSLPNQTAGQGILTCRFTNNTSINSSAAYISIGDIFAVGGQSNADGGGTANQSYSHATLKAIAFGNDYTWKELVDPADSNVGQVDTVSSSPAAAGSIWPLLATLFMADQNVPIGFVPASLSGSSISAWARNESDHDDRTTLYGSMLYRINAVGGVKAVLWWQGESEAAAGASYATCLSSYRYLSDHIYEDAGVKVVANQIGDRASTNPTSRLDNVRLAQRDLWNENGNWLPGASLYDVDLSNESGDGVHFKTNLELQTAANRMWSAIKQNFYGGVSGRGPRLVSAKHNAARTEIYLTFTSGNLPLLPASGLTTSAFAVKDDGVAAMISSVMVTAANQITITLSSAASGTLTVSFAAGRTGTGAIVPTDSSSYTMPAEIFVDYEASPSFASGAVFSRIRTGM